MKIELKINTNGEPYLELYAGEHGYDVKQELLKLFIKESKEKGLFIKNESGFELSDDYASIRINQKNN